MVELKAELNLFDKNTSSPSGQGRCFELGLMIKVR